jgi:hypothetical protein
VIITLDEDFIVEIKYKGVDGDLHVWDYKFRDEGKVIAALVNYKTASPDAKTSLDILLADTGAIEVDLTEINWYFTSIFDAFHI